MPRRIALWTIVSLLLLVAAAAAFLLTADLRFLKPQIEARASRTLGRTFVIDGDLSVRLGRHATIVANGLRLQDASWSERQDMLEVGKVEFEANLLSMLSGPFIIERIVIRDARVHVAGTDEGDSNWAMIEPQQDAEEAETGEGRGWRLRKLDVMGVDVHIDLPERPEPLDVRINSLQQNVGDDDIVATSLDASANERELSLTSRVGTWSSLLEGDRVDLDLKAQLDRVTVTAGGYVDSLSEPRRPSLAFAIEGPAVSDIYVMAGLGEHGAGDINLRGSLQPTDDGPLALTIAGNAGETVIDAVGRFSDLQHLEEAELKARANGPNLGRVLGLFGMNQVSEVPFAVTLDAERYGTLLTVRESTLDIGDARATVTGLLPEFPTLANATAAARIEGQSIERLKSLAPIPDAMRGPFLVDLELDATAGQTEAFRVVANTSLGTLSGSGSLGPAPEHYGSRANARFAAPSLAGIAAAWGIEGPGDEPVNISGDLELVAEGIRLQNVAATLGEHEATITGLVGTGAGLRGSEFEIHLQGESLGDLARAAYSIENLPSDAYRMRTTVGIDDTGYVVRTLSANVGDAALTADGLISRRADLAGSRASVALEGAALERLVPALGTRRVRPGPFSLSGKAGIDNGRLKFEQIRFERQFATIAADIEAGWPLSFDHTKFDVRGRGEDIRALIGEVGPLHLAELPYALDVSGTRATSHWSINAFDATLGDAHVRASGTVDYGNSIAATRLQFSAAIPAIARLGTINGTTPRDRALAMTASVAGQGNELVVNDLDLKIDEGAIGGSIRILPGATPEIDIDLHSDNFVLHPLTAVKDQEPAVAALADGRLIPDAPVSLELLEAFNGTFRARVAAFQRDQLHLRNVDVDARLQDGTLEVSRFGFDGITGRLDATANASADDGRYALSLKAREFALALDDTNSDDRLTGDIDSRLTSNGATLRAIAANLGGFVLVNSGGGRMPNYRFLQALYGNLLDEILSTVNPFYKAGEFTSFECIILPVEIANGQVISAPSILVLTDKIRILAQAKIDLDSEALDLSARTLPRQSLGISAAEIVNPYVKIVGTLAAPRLSLDQKGVLMAGGAAVATGGLSVLAKAAWDRLSRDADPCEEAATAAQKSLAQYLN